MFDKRFFDRNIEPRCEYCGKGYLSADKKNILCPKKGIVEKGFHCNNFDYNPLLRIPKTKMPDFSTFDPEEFKL